MNIFVDTSLLVALVHKEEIFHKKAVDLMKKFKNEGFFIDQIIRDESINVVFRKWGLKKGRFLIKWLEKYGGKFTVIEVGDEIRTTAYEDLLAGYVENGPNVFDFIHFACMKKFGIKKVLTFDKHFGDFGFEILK